MQDSEIIDALGGTGKVAAIFRISPASVSGWRERGIPDARKQTLGLLFPEIVPESWRPAVGQAETAA